jgi:hypothetical protein
MSAEVVALPGVHTSDKKQAWLDQVAQAYDAFMAVGEGEPDGLVFIALNHTGACKTSWTFDGPWLNVPSWAAVLLAADLLTRGDDA